MIAKIEIECKTVSQLRRHLMVLCVDLLNVAEGNKIDMETQAFNHECKMTRINEHGSTNAFIKPNN